MIKAIYTNTLNILKKVPVKLWGLSLLNQLLLIIIIFLGAMPLISIPVSAALSAGMAALYYSAYKGSEADSKTMLKAFTDWATFKHVAGGMCWMYLWLFLWALIPIAGPFIVIYKALSYAFTPYILLEEKSVSGIDAIKKSIQDTKGYKLKMFLAMVLPVIIIGAVSGILALLGIIPYVGIIFTVINVILTLIVSLFSSIFFGLVDAGFYDYARKPASERSAYAQQTSAPYYGPVQTPQTPPYSAPQSPQTPPVAPPYSAPQTHASQTPPYSASPTPQKPLYDPYAPQPPAPEAPSPAPQSYPEASYEPSAPSTENSQASPDSILYKPSNPAPKQPFKSPTPSVNPIPFGTIECPVCGSENRSDKMFCGKCGAKMR